MAIIECPECGEKISDSSKICVHCGFRIKNNNEEIKKAFCIILRSILLVISIIPFAFLFADFIKIDISDLNVSKISGWNLISGVDSIFEGSPYKSLFVSVYGTFAKSPTLPSFFTILLPFLSLISVFLFLCSGKYKKVYIIAGIFLLISGILCFLTKYTVCYIESGTGTLCFLSSIKEEGISISLGWGAIALGIIDICGFILSIVGFKLK